MKRFKELVSRLAIPLIVLITTWYSSNIHWGKQWNCIIASDGKGYYSYLPATFIYDDLNFGFFDTIENKYYDAHLKYDYRSMGNGKIIDKYFCGVSVLQLPFFLAGHVSAKISGAPADGYSKPYAIALNIGAIFWLMTGLIYLRKLLISFGADKFLSSVILLVFVFGTNLFYYTVAEPAMSHVYSFSLICIFLAYSKKWIDTERSKYMLFSFLVLGLITVIRPVNILILLWLPFAAGSFGKSSEGLKNLFKKPAIFVAAFVLFLIPVLIQLIIYKISTGKFFVYSYNGETFHFGKPEMINFLFSYKKGLFVYTPLLFISFFGLIPLWKQSRFRAIWMLVTLLIIVYVLSCWWMWFYGGSYGMRPMIEFYGLFALLFYFLVSGLQRKWIKITSWILILFVVMLSQFQTLQYRYEVIHWSEMNKEKYWDVFLNFDFLKKKIH